MTAVYHTDSQIKQLTWVWKIIFAHLVIVVEISVIEFHTFKVAHLL